MKEIPAEMIWQHFSSLTDLRMQYRVKHKLADIIVITICAVIATDGKRLCSSYERSSEKAAIHMVSAWASENRIIPGQVKTQGRMG